MKMTFEQYDALKQKGLTDAQIMSAAQQRGVELPSEGFIGSILKSTILKPAARFGQAVGAGIASLAGASSEQIANAAAKDQILNLPLGLGQVKIEGQKAFGEGGGKQIAADVLEAAATYAPYGRIANGVFKVASKIPLLGKVVGAGKGYVGAGAIGGYTTDVSAGLRSGEENPYKAGIGTVIGTGIPAIPGVARFVGRLAHFGTTQATGLTPETVTTLLTNPKAITLAQAENLDRASLAKQVKEAFDKRMKQLTYTGKEYEVFKNLDMKIKIHDTKLIPTGSYTTQRVETDIPTKILGKYGITIKNGKITRGPENTPLTFADRRAIEDFISDFGGASELTPRGLLNVRRALDNLSKYDKAKSDIPEAIAREMRHEYDNIAKKEIPGLKELDKRFAPEIKIIQKLKKDFFNPDGTLKDAAINKIANIAGMGKDMQLARLEKLIPGIGQKAQILKALEDIGYTQGQKVGTYVRGGNLVTGGLAFLSGGPAAALMSAIVASPQVAVPILKAVGTLRGWADDAVMQVISKLSTGKYLKPNELVMFRSAIDEHLSKLSPGDQFMDSKLGQKMVEYNKNMQPGLSIKAVDGYTSKSGVVTKQLTPENRQEIVSMIDYLRAPKNEVPYDKNMQTMIDRYAEKYGLDANAKDIDEQLELLLAMTKEAPLPGTPKNVAGSMDDLLTEARKYKTAEEFVDTVFRAKRGNSYSNVPTKYVGNTPINEFGNKIKLRQVGGMGSVDEWKSRIVNGERPLVKIDDLGGRMEVGDGHNRLEAYRQLGFTEVPTIKKSQLIDIWNREHGK